MVEFNAAYQQWFELRFGLTDGYYSSLFTDTQMLHVRQAMSASDSIC